MLFVTILAILLLVMAYITNIHYKNKKFNSYLTMIESCGTFILALTIIFQVIEYNRQIKNELIIKYSEYSKIFLDEILELFMQHPELDYYYNELIGSKKINESTKRNIILEKEITMLIFSKFAKVIIYVENEQHTKVEVWMKRVLNTFMKSDIFKQYYVNEYKPKFTGPALKEYMNNHYNI